MILFSAGLRKKIEVEKLFIESEGKFFDLDNIFPRYDNIFPHLDIFPLCSAIFYQYLKKSCQQGRYSAKGFAELYQ